MRVWWSLASLTLVSYSFGQARELFDHKSLTGWFADVPAADKDPKCPPSFIVRDGNLVSLGRPLGHLLTKEYFSDYRLTVRYRFTKGGGNCGVLVHATRSRHLYGMFPQSLEVQMQAGDAGDFWCIGQDITVPDMVARRGPKETWGVDGNKNRRIANLTDGSENPLGQWNTMVIECNGRAVSVWVNGTLVNQGSRCTTNRGRIALQAEGTEVEFASLLLEPLKTPSFDLGVR